MSDSPSSPVGNSAKPPGATGAKMPENKKMLIGAGVFVLMGILFIAVRSANSSSSQSASTTPSGIDPSTGYLYGSPADDSALGGGSDSSGGSSASQPPVSITVNPPGGSTGTTGSTGGGTSTGGGSTPKPPPKKTSNYYTVKSGDNLTRIAESHGLGSDWQRIYNSNKSIIGGNPNKIYPGQRLLIP